MTRQQEIREGMYGLGFMPADFQYFEIGGTISLTFKATAKILSYLHSQGVVIKEDKKINGNLVNELWDAMWNTKIDECRLLVKQALDKAGYVAVKPLVEK